MCQRQKRKKFAMRNVLSHLNGRLQEKRLITHEIKINWTNVDSSEKIIIGEM